jgi:hypothetical protein
VTTLARTLRAAGRDSVAVDGVSRLIGIVRAGLAAGAREPEGARFAGGEQRLVEQIANSRAVRTVQALADGFDRAWSGSRARMAIEPAAHALRMLTGPQRIRVAGLWIVVAAATDGVLSFLDPRPASAFRWASWVACIVSGALVALAATPLHAAWTERRRT